MRRLLKIIGWAVVGLVGLLVVGLGLIYGLSSAKLHRVYQVTVAPEMVATGTEAIARGRHIAISRGCAECHGPDFGGHMVIDNPAMGKIYAPNLTRGRGGLPADFGTFDLVRAIRHGIGPAGRPLFLMPSEEYAHFSTADLGALLAFLRSLPPVNRDNLPVSLGPVARVLLLTGKIKLAADVVEHAHITPSVVTPAITPDYGHYLAVSCIGCHRPDFSGGKIAAGPPDWPPAANLTPGPGAPTATWTEADFIHAVRTGHRPDGSEISPVMPRSFGNLNDLELRALWAYLRTLKPAAKS